MTLFGDPTIRAGAIFFYDGVRPELDPIDFIIESATHRLSKAGYTVDIEARLYVPAKGGKKSGKGSGASDQGSAADAGTGSAADNSPRPPQFRSARSMGDNPYL